MISFNWQVAIARVALDEITQWRDEEGWDSGAPSDPVRTAP